MERRVIFDGEIVGTEREIPHWKQSRIRSGIDSVLSSASQW